MNGRRATCRSRSRTTMGVLALALLAACGGGGESRTIVDPGGSGGGGDAEKATLTVTVRPSTDDAGVFDALGWTNTVPGATVVIQRSGSTTRSTATADAGGVATFSGLVPGSYAVSALRSLTAVERAQLAAGDQDVDAVAGANGSVSVQAPSAATQVEASAGRRGSLVVSELYRAVPELPSGAFYNFGRYLELYNNADTAVALADKVVAKGFPGSMDTPSYPCADYEFIHDDPAGVWVMDAFAFPSDTRALQPGQAVVLATDAIDHSQLAPGNAFDLSHADFEFIGTQDADNPGVPNMVILGPNSGDTPLGHGYEPYETDEVVVVASAVDMSAQPQQLIPFSDHIKMVRYPAAALLDVLVHRLAIALPYPKCSRAVNPDFDRQEAFLLDGMAVQSVRRRVVATLPDGRKVLLRTKTSARDFEEATPTPFAVP